MTDPEKDLLRAMASDLKAIRTDVELFMKLLARLIVLLLILGAIYLVGDWLKWLWGMISK